MKTKDLIKLLQEADPTGDYEVCIENSDIQSYDILPAYYDGRITVITERSSNGLHPLKSEVTGSGTKLNLYRHNWCETFIDDILYNQKEYIVDSGSGAAGQNGYNWMNAEIIGKKIKLTIIAENMTFMSNIDKIKEFASSLRFKYNSHITKYLLDYITNSSHFKTKLMSNTALILVNKCGEVGFPLEVFRFGDDYVSNKNANWIGYEFKIDKDGKFYVKDYLNNKKSEQRENGTYDCTPYVESDIETFNFKQVFDDYYEVMKNSDY